ncbi:MAG TPA: efflux RND transporter periplasmic adaptor subunit [Chloroflexota bacterium]|nr:efflux RND transporter periplasmic adaptor subunit [Chloroflexota bacterium]
MSRYTRAARAAALAFAVGFLLLSTACTKLVEEEPTPTPLPTPAESNKPIFTAKKSSITEVVKGLGRVAASDEATMYFKQSGRLKRLYVEINQKIKKDDMLAELETGTLGTQIAQARINLEVAQIGLQRASEKANTVDPSVKQAAAKISQAEAARAQAVASLQKVRSGATGADVQAADAAVAAAQATLEKSQADVAKLKAPKSPDELAAAKAVVEKAQAVLQQAQASYDRIASRPDAAGSSQAVALQQATADYQAAVARYNLASQGARPEDVTAAEKAVESAQAAVQSAVARGNQTKAGPLPADVAGAQAGVEVAEANLEAARAEYDAKVTQAGLATSNFDVQIAQKQVELASVSLKTLEEQMADSQLKAPFDGIITSTTGREGDVVQAYTPVVVIANPSSILVALEVNPQDLNKIAVGQDAVITIDAFKGQRFESKVVGLPNASAGPQPQALARTVKLSFIPPGPVDLGALANVTITTQKKDDVILIPNQALRRFGGRKYVQVIAENGRKREVDVETGIATDTETEIIKGIKEGTRVVSQ